MGASSEDRPRDARLPQDRHRVHVDAARGSAGAGDPGLGSPRRNPIRSRGWRAMATVEGLTAAIDQVIAFFNARKMDLPDGFFDRKTQFLINGAPFETLLGQSPTDALILMLTRGPAGFRFTAKALQHAIPDARVDRASTPPAQLVEPASLMGA